MEGEVVVVVGGVSQQRQSSINRNIMIKRSKLIDVPKHLQIIVSTSTLSYCKQELGFYQNTNWMEGCGLAVFKPVQPGNKFHILQKSKDLR